MTRKLIPPILIFALFGILAAGAYLLCATTAIRITVVNVGSTTMRDAAVQVAKMQEAHELGEIPPGASKTLLVWPNSTGGIQLRFVHEKDEHVKLDLNGYVESGYAGHIAVDVRDGKIVRLVNNVRVTSFWRTQTNAMRKILLALVSLSPQAFLAPPSRSRLYHSQHPRLPPRLRHDAFRR